MRSTFLEEVKYEVKNWWMSLILGILFIAVALILMFTPIQSYVVISIMFSLCMFAGGIFEILFAMSNKDNLSGWGWYLAGGIVDLLLGILLIAMPGLSMAVIPFIVAFWLMFRAFSAIGFSVDLQRYGAHNWGWPLVFGILGVVCSIAIIFWPLAGALTAVYVVAFSFLFIGIFRVMLAYEFKNLKNNNDKLTQRLHSLETKYNL